MSSPTETTLTPEKTNQLIPAEEVSLYVGDLLPSVTEADLIKVFGQASTVKSAHICKDKFTKLSKGYGFVSYETAEEAAVALHEYNQSLIGGKPCRVMNSKRGRTTRNYPENSNIFVKNLPKHLSPLAFHDTFESYGQILSSKLVLDLNHRSRGYGYIQYSNPAQAKRAISEANGTFAQLPRPNQSSSDPQPLKPIKPIYVGLFIKTEDRQSKKKNQVKSFNNVFFKNLPLQDFDLLTFIKKYESFGKISSAYLTKDSEGKVTGTGFIHFSDPKVAAQVIKAAQKDTESAVEAVRAISKTERQAYKVKPNKSV